MKNENTARAVFAWLRANGHQASLAAMTGQDAKAIFAVALLWELYAAADAAGRIAAVQAVRALVLSGMQPKVHDLARELIARSMDWEDIAPLWQLVTATDTSHHPTPEQATSVAATSRGGVARCSSDAGDDAPIPFRLTPRALELFEVTVAGVVR